MTNQSKVIYTTGPKIGPKTSDILLPPTPKAVRNSMPLWARLTIAPLIGIAALLSTAALLEYNGMQTITAPANVALITMSIFLLMTQNDKAGSVFKWLWAYPAVMTIWTLFIVTRYL